jgi:hypothetical protein
VHVVELQLAIVLPSDAVVAPASLSVVPPPLLAPEPPPPDGLLIPEVCVGGLSDLSEEHAARTPRVRREPKVSEAASLMPGILAPPGRAVLFASFFSPPSMARG